MKVGSRSGRSWSASWKHRRSKNSSDSCGAVRTVIPACQPPRLLNRSWKVSTGARGAAVSICTTLALHLVVVHCSVTSHPAAPYSATHCCASIYEVAVMCVLCDAASSCASLFHRELWLIRPCFTSLRLTLSRAFTASHCLALCGSDNSSAQSANRSVSNSPI